MAHPTLKSANARTAFSQNHSYSMTKFYIESLTGPRIKFLIISAGKIKLIGDTIKLMNMSNFQKMILGLWYIIKLIFCLMLAHGTVFVITQPFISTLSCEDFLCRPWKFSLPASIFRLIFPLIFSWFIYIISCYSSFSQFDVACILNSQKDVNENWLKTRCFYDWI